MKHLKTVNELLKSTYLSASKKLRGSHSKRAEDLIDHGIKKGKNVKQERIYPHRFLFDNTLEGEYFFITGCTFDKIKDKYSPNLQIKIDMRSNWDNHKVFALAFDIYDIDRYNIEKSELRFRQSKSDEFKNKDPKIARLNARHLLRFFNQYWEDGEDDDLCDQYGDYVIKELSINSLYKSN